jgi:hypothetical protein
MYCERARQSLGIGVTSITSRHGFLVSPLGFQEWETFFVNSVVGSLYVGLLIEARFRNSNTVFWSGFHKKSVYHQLIYY